MNYHAHVYFDHQEERKALETLQKVKTELSPLGIRSFEYCRRPVGPHPKAMFELHFTTKSLEKVKNWLSTNLEGRSVLIHEDTGDDFKDHTDGAIWLGKHLPLDFSIFKRP